MVSLWLSVVLLMTVALAPLVLALRSRANTRGRREAALALHRAQLAELDRDRDQGRIGHAEHMTAVLEVQRRLLAAANTAEPLPTPASRGALWLVLVLVPLAAVLLYLTGGSPGLPAMPLKERIAAAEQRVRQEQVLIGKLRDALATLDPKSDKARQGNILLGDAEARLGHMHQAANAWQSALDVQFDPTLAVETAEAMTEAKGHVTPKAAALFRRALTDGPADAPWRPIAERRLGGG
jgi:cytochrome c-type biogenesis protein CcmH